MKHLTRAFVLTALSATAAVLAATSVFAQDIKLETQVNRNSIYIGESVALTVRVAGADDSRLQPDLSAITNATVRSLGNHSGSFSSTLFVNGRLMQDSFTGRIYSYELQPLAAGQFKAGPVKLNVNGKLLIADGPVIQVAGIEQQDSVILRISSSHDAILVGEQFEITFSLALKRLGQPYEEADPLDPGEPPDLNVPFLADAPIDGLETARVLDFLNKHLTGRGNPGFHLNNYTTQPDVFSFNFNDPFGSRKALFIFDRQKMDKDGKAYFEYTAKILYTAQKEGSYTFGPAEFKGKIAIGADERSRAITKPFFAVGPACTVRVIPPPDEGRPTSYIGALGTNMTADAKLDTQNCNVGDPLKLTVTIGGGVRLGELWVPRLNLQPELAKRFRIIDDSVDTTTKNGSREFVYSVRPTEAGTYEFPSIEVSYFDSVTRSYKTIRTAPIPIRVQATATVQTANILYADNTNGAERGVMEVNPSTIVIAPLKVEPSGSRPDNIGIARWQVPVLAAGPLLLLLVLAGRYVRSASPRIADYERKRNAAREAKSLLKEALKLHSRDPGLGRRQIYEAVRDYIGNRTGTRTSGLTPAEARTEIFRLTSDQNLAEQTERIMEANFNAAFSQSSSDPAGIAEDSEKAMRLIQQIETQLGKTK